MLSFFKSLGRVLNDIVAEENRDIQAERDGSDLSGSSTEDMFNILTDRQHAWEEQNAETMKRLDAAYARKLATLPNDKRYSTVEGVLTAGEIEIILGRNPNYASRRNIPRRVPSRIQLRSEDPRKIVTTFHIDAWRSVLSEYGLLSKHEHILDRMKNGFPLGVDWDLRQTLIHKHHGSAIRHSDVIEAYIQKEEAAGRYSRPYRREELERLIGPFFCAPMGTVDKPDKPGKKRVIHDNTYPGVKSERALNTHCRYESDTYSWLAFEEMAERVKTAPYGTQACAFDGEAAYRMCATRLEDQRFTCIEWKGLIRVDRSPHFGVRNAGVPHGQVADVLHEIIQAKWPNAIPGKWQDDHIIIQKPATGFFGTRLTFALQDIIDLTNKLGYPTNRDKDQQFTEIITYIGFLWSFRDRTVSLTQKKKEAYIQCIDDVLARKPQSMSLEELVELNGQLTHTCQVFPRGGSHLRSFIGEIKVRGGYDKPNKSKHRKERSELKENTLSDMKWWRRTLQDNIPMPLKDIPTFSDKWVVYTDASGDWGIGVVINNEWDCWRMDRNWETWRLDEADSDSESKRYIGWAEGIAVEVAVHILLRHFKIPNGTHIRILCDNKGFVDSWRKGYARRWEDNAIIVRVFDEFLNAGCWISLEHIPGAENLADGPSRGKGLSGKTRAKWGENFTPLHLTELLTRA